MTTKPPFGESGAQLEQALDKLDDCVVIMKAASKESIETSERFARTVRSARPSRSNPGFRAVRPGEPLPDDESDLTGAFAALKRAL